jgi:hypothetical protein
MSMNAISRSAVTGLIFLLAAGAHVAIAQNLIQQVVPKDLRGRNDAERSGIHDAGGIRTVFYNFGMVGDYPADPLKVDLSIFHSAEVPKGSGMNYTDGITPFVLANIVQTNGLPSYIMETGFRERQQQSPVTAKVMRFEPRPGYMEADPSINTGRSIAISNDPRTWPASWPDKAADTDDPGWAGSWNGYFGKRPNADEESFFVMDDDFYDAWQYHPDARDATRHGLGLRVEVRGFQWANPQASNVIFWHYDITNESTTDYLDNIIFGLYMDSGIGGSAISCDGIAESDDDNAFFDRSLGLNMTYTWDTYGHGANLSSNCAPTGYLGYAYMETPGNPYDGIDNDDDGITDERRDSGPGNKIVGQQAIRDSMLLRHYNMAKFEAFYGKLEDRPAYKAGIWWTGDENLNWVAEYDDVGKDGVPGTRDIGEGDGMPTAGEPDFDQTDKDESDQIGLTGFKMNRIKGPSKSDPVDDIVFYGFWPQFLYQKFTNANTAARFDSAVVLNYNIAFLFASGTFRLPAGSRERFSLALAYGDNLDDLRGVVKTVQQIYNANYQFAVPPPLPSATAESGDRYVRLTWSDYSERGVDPITHKKDFEGYKIYRSTDPEFRDPKTITNALGTGFIGNGRPIAQFDLKNGIKGFSREVISGTAYYLGNDGGIQHAWVDTTVKNGQDYYYAVCAYDHGDDSLQFYPSENAITVSRTPRGGTILPANVVLVRPEPKTSGYRPASSSTVRHVAGPSTATVGVQIVNSRLVPDGRTYFLRFVTDTSSHIHASRYEMYDSLSATPLLAFGADFRGEARGPSALGILPVVASADLPYIDTARTGFGPAHRTNARVNITPKTMDSANVARPGYPADLAIIFAATPIDTMTDYYGRRTLPVKMTVMAATASGPRKMPFYLFENSSLRNGTLDRIEEYIDVLTYFPTDTSSTALPRVTWRIQLVDTTGLIAPTAGDTCFIGLGVPVTAADVYAFRTRGQTIDPALARQQTTRPYVVPNPYVGAASFEPERFLVTGRGERRIEFRGLPARAVVRIFNVRGELVQTLTHDGGTDGFVPWNLRTKDNLDVAPGLYIFHVEANDYDSYTGKFAIIK